MVVDTARWLGDGDWEVQGLNPTREALTLGEIWRHADLLTCFCDIINCREWRDCLWRHKLLWMTWLLVTSSIVVYHVTADDVINCWEWRDRWWRHQLLCITWLLVTSSIVVTCPLVRVVQPVTGLDSHSTHTAIYITKSRAVLLNFGGCGISAVYIERNLSIKTTSRNMKDKMNHNTRWSLTQNQLISRTRVGEHLY